MAYLRNALLATTFVVATIGACATGSTDFESEPTDDATSSSSAGGTTGSGGAGGAMGCQAPSDCPGEDTNCRSRTCDAGECGETFAPAGATCAINDGVMCDGMGQCVECVEEDDCTSGVCNAGTCEDASCMDSVQNGDESDVDCGGATCAGCQNGEMCNDASDCLSGVCDGTQTPNVCIACTMHSDCAMDEYCDGDICQPLKPLGDPCGGPYECDSGFCPTDDGVCCDVACDGGCESCTIAGNQTADGTCGPTLACIDADGCCPAACDETNDDDCAILDLDVGTHSSTWGPTSSTRGFWFTAPVDFTIHELRVPTSVGTGQQNIQVVRFPTTPPSYPTETTNFTTLHYSTANAGTGWVSVNIPISQGDVIGILGARGTSSVSTSYAGVNPIPSLILGNSVSLNRLVYQQSLATSAAGPLSTETGGNAGRIEVRYGP
jgi:hypothetical protein